MNVNVVNQNSFLQTSRRFPQDNVTELAFQMNLAYVDIANAVNTRIISLFSTSRPAVTGEIWMLNPNIAQSVLRQVYTFTTTTSIAHNIDFSNVQRFTRMFGTYSDGTNWYGLPAGTSVAIPGQITFYVTPTNIVFVVGAGAPTITSGNVVLEWMTKR